MTCALKAIRERRGLSQQELAERVGLSQPALSKLERGKHAPKGLASALAIAAVLRVSVRTIWPGAATTDATTTAPPRRMPSHTAARNRTENSGESRIRRNARRG